MLSIKRGFTVVEFIVVVVIIAILAVFLFPVSSRGVPENYPRVACQSNLKQVGLGFVQYSQDNDEKFPPTSSSQKRGWANLIQPYLKSRKVFRCPLAKSQQDETSDYFYNARLARFSLANVEIASQTIMLGDGTLNALTNVSLSTLPKSWISAAQSPAKRHLDGANYAFADGHVKWSKPQRITLDSPRKSTNSTFLPR